MTTLPATLIERHPQILDDRLRSATFRDSSHLAR
jgi:hypothetical protein